jgi:SPIRAL1-like protein
LLVLWHWLQEEEEQAPPPAFIEATETQIKAMMIAELRIVCRENGVSPAGAKPTLVNRICEAIQMGQCRVMVANRGVSGLSNTVNNYNRSEGQNVGNFMTVGRCRLTVSKPELKARLVSALETKM